MYRDAALDGGLVRNAGQQRKGRPRKTCYQVVDNDLTLLKIDRDLEQN